MPWSARQSFVRVAYLDRYASPLPESHISASTPVFCPSRVSRSIRQSFAQVTYLGQSASPLPESCVSASTLVLCPSRISHSFHQSFARSRVPRPTRQSFAQVAYLGRYASPLPESHVSASLPVLCPSSISRPVHQSFTHKSRLILHPNGVKQVTLPWPRQAQSTRVSHRSLSSSAAVNSVRNLCSAQRLTSDLRAVLPPRPHAESMPAKCLRFHPLRPLLLAVSLVLNRGQNKSFYSKGFR
ncbi:hypothetical protein GW17_00043198 [Ensete ventricosum]|nr:hypothetical protein GW17_00043198 [Ensete ventricosum]